MRKQSRRPVVIVSILLLLNLGLFFLKLTLTKNLDSTDASYAKLLEHIRIVKQQNQLLYDQILQATSLQTIASEAATLQMQPETVLYLNSGK